MGCKLNIKVQSPIAMPEHITWCKTNAQKLAIDRLKGGKRRKKRVKQGLHIGEIAVDCLIAWSI